MLTRFVQVHIEPSLELRLALHYPTTVKMPESKAKSAVRLVEPPGIEGYLTRVKTKGVNDRVYLSSHDGHLFVCRPSSAHPPEPPAPIARLPQNPAELVLTPLVMGFATIGANEQRKRKRDAFASRINLRSISGASSKQDMQTTTRALKSMQGSSTPGGQIDDDGEDDLLAVLDRQEKIRAYQQITNARGFVDLQDVVDVRVATHEGEIDAAEGILDIGGPDGLAVSEDKALLLRQRSFVINLKGGATVTFEVSGERTDLRNTANAHVRPQVSLNRRSTGMGRSSSGTHHLLAPPSRAGCYRADGAHITAAASSSSLIGSHGSSKRPRYDCAARPHASEQGLQLLSSRAMSPNHRFWALLRQARSTRHVQRALSHVTRRYTH